ncbi:MAG: hypothetical protein KGJ39_00645 [Acidobacteriota bacterium]|nr:hypothetical protein [Acidobacteriota bacterium]
MAKYMISFGANAMDHIPAEDMPAVAAAAHSVVQEIVNAGVYVVAGAIDERKSSVVATDGAVSDGSELREISGLTIIDVPTYEEALAWAAKIAVACRCAQDVRAIGPDPALDAMLGHSS